MKKPAFTVTDDDFYEGTYEIYSKLFNKKGFFPKISLLFTCYFRTKYLCKRNIKYNAH